jgi:hypothetical protein
MLSALLLLCLLFLFFTTKPRAQTLARDTEEAVEAPNEQERGRAHWRDFLTQSLLTIRRQEQSEHNIQQEQQDAVPANRTSGGSGWRAFADNLDRRLNELWTATTNTSRIKTRVSTALAALVNGTTSSRKEVPKVPFTILHYTDTLTLERLYRVIRAQDQARQAGYSYKVLYWLPYAKPWPQESVNDINVLKDLLIGNDSLCIIDLAELTLAFPALVKRLSRTVSASDVTNVAAEEEGTG